MIAGQERQTERFRIANIELDGAESAGVEAPQLDVLGAGGDARQAAAPQDGPARPIDFDLDFDGRGAGLREDCAVDRVVVTYRIRGGE